MEELRKVLGVLESGFSTADYRFTKDDILEAIDRLYSISSSGGFSELALLSRVMKDYIDSSPWNDPSFSETKQLLQFAFATLRERIEANGGVPSGEHISEFCELTGISLNGEPEEKDDSISSSEELPKIEAILESPSGSEQVNFQDLHNIVQKIGGEVIPEDKNENFFTIRFPAKNDVVSYLRRVFALSDPDEDIMGSDVSADPKLLWLVGKIKEFMFAFSQGDLKGARDVLRDLSISQAEKGGLYDEIGKLARQLHEALKNLAKSIDPQLKEFAEVRLPDSGDRLEHILKLTEHAANTTLDHVEVMQNRKEEEIDLVTKIETLSGLLYPLGDSARSRLDEITRISEALKLRFNADHEDLLKIMTAQDFQDLTGQVIMKIIHLLKDLEVSLINLITGFGIPIGGKREEKRPAKEFLYGPAHDKKDALKSQEDVDALLAEFGF